MPLFLQRSRPPLYCGTATQMPAPSNENVPPMLTVRLDCTTLLPGGNWLAATPAQAGVPAGGAGTTKLIWYKPMPPAVAPANNGAWLPLGRAGKAFAR